MLSNYSRDTYLQKKSADEAKEHHQFYVDHLSVKQESII